MESRTVKSRDMILTSRKDIKLNSEATAIGEIDCFIIRKIEYDKNLWYANMPIL